MNQIAVQAAKDEPVQKKPYERVEYVQAKTTAIPLHDVAIGRELIVFHSHDWNQSTAPLLTLETNQFDEVALGILVDKIILPLLSSFRHQAQNPPCRRFRPHVLKLLETLRALRDLQYFADPRPSDRPHADHQPAKHAGCVNTLVWQELVPLADLQKVDRPEVGRPERQQAAIWPCALTLVSPLAAESFPLLGKIAVAAHVQVAKHTVPEKIEKPEGLRWAVFREAGGCVVFDEVGPVLRGKTALAPTPLQRSGWGFSVPKRYGIVPQ